ncbi:MAG: cell division protein FtsW [Candidatus Marinimicrobia bacterium]|nr:cell division protein FtsW [Candidatus Neomarinimicrobiota bacterium]MBT4148886.1 cell division protein FtsW [Candidatus Neomarinimicrobiota bacterium]MBT4318915.1 cell division protein FtsW [Candidatus Neomarinimicrobiota bacterium]MBT4784380.1 cell division protein FtsW [Candidatus Neomarinimicrobiota bacterium]MBT5096733.1 cell division protein FtsW [Candidatus Neomarinimicrobiota bacterium]
MKHIDIITKKYDQLLLILIIILCVMGTVMLYSASSSISLNETGGLTDTLFIRSHLKRLLLGILIMFLFIIIDYRKFKSIAPYLMIFSIILLLATKIMYLVKGINFPARWLDLGLFTVQTSDIARFSLILYIAYYIDKKRESLKDFYNGFLPPVLLMAGILFTIVIQPDFSTAAVIGLIGFSMLFIGGAKLSHIITTGVISIVIMIPVMLMRSYRMKRVIYWLGSIFGINSGSEQEVIGYQAQQSLISLGNGGFWGLGLGNSLEKNLFLPTPHTDFIFAIIGEELGFIGAIFVISLFLFIFQRGIKIAKETTDPFGVMLAVGISFSIIIYSFINVAVVTGIFPVTGLPMPLVSHGGSSLIMNLACLGMLLNISQAKRSVSHATSWKPQLNV